MSTKLGRALREELRGVRVDDALKTRILAATRQRRRRRVRVGMVAAAAALLVIGVGLGLMLSRPRPDAVRQAVLSPGGGEASGAVEPTYTPTVAVTPEPTIPPEPDDEALDGANLYLYASAFEGGVLCVESAYAGGDSGIAQIDSGLEWQCEPALDLAAAERTLAGLVDGELIGSWEEAWLQDNTTGIQYDDARVYCMGITNALATSADAVQPSRIVDGLEYRFAEPNAPENTMALYLLDHDWPDDAVELLVMARHGEWGYDGSDALSRVSRVRQSIEPLSDNAFALEAWEETRELPEIETVTVPVEWAGGATLYEGAAGWANADTGGEDFGMTMRVIVFDSGATVVLLEPREGHALTARIHAVKAPRMVLDQQAHPGMAGWVFDEGIDGGDVIDVMDEHGGLETVSCTELMSMVGAADPEDMAPEAPME